MKKIRFFLFILGLSFFLSYSLSWGKLINFNKLNENKDYVFVVQPYLDLISESMDSVFELEERLKSLETFWIKYVNLKNLNFCLKKTPRSDTLFYDHFKQSLYLYIADSGPPSLSV